MQPSVLTTTKSSHDADRIRMFVPTLAFKEKETVGLVNSNSQEWLRDLGSELEVNGNLALEWNECRYFDLLTPTCQICPSIARHVVRTSCINPMFPLSTLSVHIHIPITSYRLRFCRQT